VIIRFGPQGRASERLFRFPVASRIPDGRVVTGERGDVT
jgi:hypothetical protein